jgi:hypothetical protein
MGRSSEAWPDLTAPGVILCSLKTGTCRHGCRIAFGAFALRGAVSIFRSSASSQADYKAVARRGAPQHRDRLRATKS